MADETTEHDLLSATVPTAGDRLTVASENKAPVAFRPYTAIGDETCRTYQPLRSI